MSHTGFRRAGMAAVLLALHSASAADLCSRNVILMIVDGMGYQHVDAAAITSARRGLASTVLPGVRKLLCSHPSQIPRRLQRQGYGGKERWRYLQARTASRASPILEIAKDMGKRTGLVTTSHHACHSAGFGGTSLPEQLQRHRQ